MELEDQAVVDQAVATVDRREPRSIARYAGVVFGVAAGSWVVLALVGARLPSAAAVLLLTIVVALCVNRFALFPSEHASTAEAAVLLAAVVGFHDDAAYLGPLAVALLVGPLDTLHWAQRSFVRMAYNAGNRGLSTLAATATFAAVSHSFDGSVPAAIVAVVGAVAGFAVVDLALSVVLLRLQGTGMPTALREILAVDVLTVPVAVYGAAVGSLAVPVGWWAVALALLPAAFVPEVVLGRWRWRAAVARDVVIVSLVVAVLVAFAVLAPLPAWSTLCVLVALAMVTGAFLGTQRWVVPPTLAVLVMTAGVVTPGNAAFLAATLTALAGTLAAWRAIARAARAPMSYALLVALVGATVAMAIWLAAPSTRSGATVAALLAGCGFEVVSLASSGSRRGGAQLLWAVPVLTGAAAWAFLWRAVGAAGAVSFAAGLSATMVTVAWWGPCLWRSSARVGTMGERVARRLLRILAVVGVCAVGVVVVGLTIDDHDLRAVLGWAGVAIAETAVAMVLAGVRQWRFAPRVRIVTLLGLLGVSLILVLSVPALVAERDALVVPLLAIALAVVGACGVTPAARAREVADARAATSQAR